MGIGDVPRDESGEGVAPRERTDPSRRFADSPEVKGWDSAEEVVVLLRDSSSSSSIKDTSRRGRDRTSEVEAELAPAGLELRDALATLF